MEKGKGPHLRTDVSQARKEHLNAASDCIVPNPYSPVKRLDVENIVCVAVIVVATLYLAAHLVAAILAGRMP